MSTQKMPEEGQKVRITRIDNRICNEVVTVTEIDKPLLTFDFEPRIYHQGCFDLESDADQYEPIEEPKPTKTIRERGLVAAESLGITDIPQQTRFLMGYELGFLHGRIEELNNQLKKL